MNIALKKTIGSLQITAPIILGVLLFINLLNPLLQKFYPSIFTGNYLIDPLIGAIAGSASFGIPIISYITGGELLKQGVSLLAVIAFILSWSTVGLVMMPLEITHLGKKFAIWRNSINFFTSIIIAILTAITLNLIK